MIWQRMKVNTKFKSCFGWLVFNAFNSRLTGWIEQMGLCAPGVKPAMETETRLRRWSTDIKKGKNYLLSRRKTLSPNILQACPLQKLQHAACSHVHTKKNPEWSKVVFSHCSTVYYEHMCWHHKAIQLYSLFPRGVILLRSPADWSDLAGMQDRTIDNRLEETDLIIRMTSIETKRLYIYCINFVSNNLNKTADSFVGWTEQDFLPPPRMPLW